jgi:hypothetical protein
MLFPIQPRSCVFISDLRDRNPGAGFWKPDFSHAYRLLSFGNRGMKKISADNEMYMETW